MSYCTVAHYTLTHGESELIQLTDREGVLGAVNQARFSEVSAKADALINQRLRSKGWSLPLSADVLVVSEDLRNISLDITRYYLHGHLSEIPKPVQADFELALKTLSDYVKGLLTLDIGVPPSVVNNGGNSGAGDVDFSAPARVFTDDSLRGF